MKIKFGGGVFATLLLVMALAAGSVMAQELDTWGHREGISPAGWSATATVNADSVANAIDGDPSTVWTAKLSAGDYIEVNLGDVYAVNRLEWHTASFNANAYPQNFRIDVSVDGQEWTTVADSEGLGAYSAEPEILDKHQQLLQVIWPATDAQYIRIVQTADQDQPVELKVLSVWEQGMTVGALIEDMVFYPEVLLVEVGTEISWLQVDFMPHTVTEGKPSTPDSERLFDSAQGQWIQLMHGETFELDFVWADTVEYFCLPHPTMIGWVRGVEW